MATDVDGVYLDWGKPTQRAGAADDAGRDGAPPVRGRQHGAEGEAACEFVASHGQRAAIGALADIERIVAGEAGTIVEPDAA